MTDIRHIRQERFIDMLLPLIVIAVTMALHGKGFPSLWPALPCTVFSLVQPFTRGFIFDTARPAFYNAGQMRIYYALEALFYVVVSIFISKLFI